MKHIDVSFLRSRGRIAALAAVLLLPAATGSYAAPSATWTGSGSASWGDPGSWSGGIVPGDGTQAPEDVFVNLATDQIQYGGNYTINSLTNNGLITADNNMGVLAINGGIANQSGGNITSNYVSSFEIDAGGGLDNAGHIGAAYGADQQNSLIVAVNGDIHNTGTIDSTYGGVTTMESLNGSLTNDAALGSTQQGTTFVYAANITNNGDVNAKFGGATVLSSFGDLKNNGAMTASFGAEIDASATGNFVNTNTVSAIQGTKVSVNASGAITNESAGSVSASQYGTVDLLAGGDLNNHGAIAASQGGVVTLSSTSGLVYNDGSITTDSGGGVVVTGDLIQTGGQTKINGSLTLGSGSGTFYLEKGGLGGGGTIDGSVVQDGGTFAPGDPTTTHITGNYIENNGVTRFVINSPHDFDQIDIDGSYTYTGGVIDLQFTQSFFQSRFHSGLYEFDFLKFASFIGDPSAIQFTTNMSPDNYFSVSLDTGAGVYRGLFASSHVTVPEPGGGVIFLTLASSLSILLWAASRRQAITR
ncbi:hypothetical protein CCAX7_17050 [Capsulimonas corticalis]|uniref:Uncharacterized protein n=1 Tax=Capsulimonas corticalis TaxID=2219043 RepID=A0A402D463_9BACT|nr:hypothetical protein [Capsulimonas corticalis]BDI29654.1 hypothetical protein CCAX7_17050 [Capsulimonas corticalis]